VGHRKHALRSGPEDGVPTALMIVPEPIWPNRTVQLNATTEG